MVRARRCYSQSSDLQQYRQGDYVREEMKEKMISVCEAKIIAKGSNVGLSFYAFFANKNDDPELLMEVAQIGRASCRERV